MQKITQLIVMIAIQIMTEIVCVCVCCMGLNVCVCEAAYIGKWLHWPGNQKVPGLLPSQAIWCLYAVVCLLNCLNGNLVEGFIASIGNWCLLGK